MLTINSNKVLLEVGRPTHGLGSRMYLQFVLDGFKATKRRSEATTRTAWLLTEENVSSNVHKETKSTQLLEINFLNDQLIEQNPVRKILSQKDFQAGWCVGFN